MSEKILIVDDDQNICELLRLYIEKEGYQIQLVPLSDNILKNGRITSNPQKRQYKIITKKDESEEEYEYIF